MCMCVSMEIEFIENIERERKPTEKKYRKLMKTYGCYIILWKPINNGCDCDYERPYQVKYTVDNKERERKRERAHGIAFSENYAEYNVILQC